MTKIPWPANGSQFIFPWPAPDQDDVEEGPGYPKVVEREGRFHKRWTCAGTNCCRAILCDWVPSGWAMYHGKAYCGSCAEYLPDDTQRLPFP